jgi:hypothetical protein
MSTSRPLTDQEWADIKAKILELARQKSLEAKVYPARKQPSLPQSQEQERKRA